MKTISVIGLGKLGAPLAVAIASRGFKVIGLDLNKKNVAALNQARPHITEPAYPSLLKRHQKNLIATSDYHQAVNNSTISFIVVPTPSQKNGSFSNKFVIQAIRSVGKALRQKNSYHLVAVVSTLSPQSMQRQVLPALSQSSQKQLAKGFGLCYNPTFIALGQVIQNLLKPDFVLIGQTDQKSGQQLASFWKKVCLNQPPIKCMDTINAEIAKIALNTFVTTKISYANMLAQLCQRLPGADAQVITQAIGLDSRVGKKYLQPGPPFGGPCFPRDNRALIASGKKQGVSLPLARATDAVNQTQLDYLYHLIAHHTPAKGKIAVLGLAYKENTDVVDEAAGVKLAQRLSRKYQVRVFDPIVKIKLGKNIRRSNSLQACVNRPDVLVITTRDQQLIKLAIKALNQIKKTTTIIDCWRLLPEKLAFPAKVIYLGKHYEPKKKKTN